MPGSIANIASLEAFGTESYTIENVKINLKLQNPVSSRWLSFHIQIKKHSMLIKKKISFVMYK